MTRRYRITCLTLLAGILTLLLPEAGFTQTGVLQGVVLDDATEAPVAGARVEATRSGARAQGTLADSAGHFVLPLPAGTYNITASRQGFAISRPIELTVGLGDTVDVEIRSPCRRSSWRRSRWSPARARPM